MNIIRIDALENLATKITWIVLSFNMLALYMFVNIRFFCRIINLKCISISFTHPSGICGSCAMNINGENTLACLCKIDAGQDKPVKAQRDRTGLRV